MTALGNIVKAAALGALWLYKRTLSPVLYFFGARCRHYPSCSDYAVEAFHQHSPWRAFWLTLSRLARCHPFGSHGIDPVPRDLSGAWWQIWRLGDWAWTERGAGKPQKTPAKLDEPPGL
jgi:uncharacterized protein